jgi:hypothetical protein
MSRREEQTVTSSRDTIRPELLSLPHSSPTDSFNSFSSAGPSSTTIAETGEVTPAEEAAINVAAADEQIIIVDQLLERINDNTPYAQAARIASQVLDYIIQSASVSWDFVMNWIRIKGAEWRPYFAEISFARIGGLISFPDLDLGKIVGGGGSLLGWLQSIVSRTINQVAKAPMALSRVISTKLSELLKYSNKIGFTKHAMIGINSAIGITIAMYGVSSLVGYAFPVTTSPGILSSGAFETISNAMGVVVPAGALVWISSTIGGLSSWLTNSSAANMMINAASGVPEAFGKLATEGGRLVSNIIAIVGPYIVSASSFAMVPFTNMFETLYSSIAGYVQASALIFSTSTLLPTYMTLAIVSILMTAIGLIIRSRQRNSINKRPRESSHVASIRLANRSRCVKQYIEYYHVRTRIHEIWFDMINECKNPSVDSIISSIDSISRIQIEEPSCETAMEIYSSLVDFVTYSLSWIGQSGLSSRPTPEQKDKIMSILTRAGIEQQTTNRKDADVYDAFFTATQVSLSQLEYLKDLIDKQYDEDVTRQVENSRDASAYDSLYASLVTMYTSDKSALKFQLNNIESCVKKLGRRTVGISGNKSPVSTNSTNRTNSTNSTNSTNRPKQTRIRTRR